MIRRLFKVATMAGLVGLVVLHADDFANVASKTLGTFRAAVKLA